METKHTPGPWSYWSGYNPVDKIEAQVTAEGGDIVIASYNHLIAEGEANAKLMGAAPDLLEALATLMRVVSDPDCAEGLALGSARAKAISAINKATA
nr:hypothetical protein [uncultured Pseudomonas sp.]